MPLYHWEVLVDKLLSFGNVGNGRILFISARAWHLSFSNNN